MCIVAASCVSFPGVGVFSLPFTLLILLARVAFCLFVIFFSLLVTVAMLFLKVHFLDSFFSEASCLSPLPVCSVCFPAILAVFNFPWLWCWCCFQVCVPLFYLLSGVPGLQRALSVGLLPIGFTLSFARLASWLSPCCCCCCCLTLHPLT